MLKIIHPWNVKIGKMTRKAFCKIEIDNGNLSISGVVGPLPSGNCHGSAGQIVMDFKQYDYRGYLSLSDITPAPGWDREMIKKFLDTWNLWHMNDFKAGCIHQRALGWDDDLVDSTKPPSQDNMKMWQHPPVGHLTEPCPVCGYKYGTAWLKEEIPADVIDFLNSLPDTDVTPAWV